MDPIRHDLLVRRLRRDAAGALPEPEPGLEERIRQALAGAHRQQTPTRARRTRSSPPSVRLLLASAAALLVALVTLGPERDAEVMPEAPQSPRHQLSLLQPPIPPLIAASVAQPLLTEWENLTHDARGTASYLIEQLRRPLRDLRSLTSGRPADG